MAQSPQVIMTNSGDRNFQAIMAGGEGIGKGLSSLGQAISAMRERQKQREDEGLVKNLMQKYGSHAKTYEAAPPSEQKTMDTPGAWLKNALIGLSAENPRAAASAAQLVGIVDPETSMQTGLGMDPAARVSQRNAEEQMAKARMAQESQRQDSEAFQILTEGQRLPPNERIQLYNSITQMVSRTGQSMLSNAAGAAIQKAVQSAIEEQTATKKIEHLSNTAGMPVQMRIAQIRKQANDLGVDPADRLGSSQAIAEVLGESEKENAGYYNLKEAIAYAMREGMRKNLGSAPPNETAAESEARTQTLADISSTEFGIENIHETLNSGISKTALDRIVQYDKMLEGTPGKTSPMDPAEEKKIRRWREEAKSRIISAIASMVSTPAVDQPGIKSPMSATDFGRPISSYFSNLDRGIPRLIEELIDEHKKPTSKTGFMSGSSWFNK